MTNPVYDLIIGNIDGARDPSNPDTDWGKQWKTKSDEVNVEGLAVQTRGQAKQEKEKFKTLKVPSISGNSVTVDDMRTAQRNDITLEKYREYANSGTRKFTGQQNVSWFVMEDDLLFRYFQSPKVIPLEMVFCVQTMTNLKQLRMLLAQRPRNRYDRF
nr:uncharacterized protein LOC117686998 [Crassostrea gigas]